MTDKDCRPLEERENLMKQDPPQYSTFKVLRGCKGYDWFCTNIENKIVRAWEVNGLCTDDCEKETWYTVRERSPPERQIMGWFGENGGVGCSMSSSLYPGMYLAVFALALGLTETFSK